MKVIYMIRCLVNNRVYIGQTCNYKRRLQQHKWELKHVKHSNKFLQADYNTYGIENFQFSILEVDIPDEKCLIRETYYMNLYGGTNSNSIYNVKGNFNDDNKEYALSNVSHCCGKFDLFKGRTHSPESKQKISASLKKAYSCGEHKLAGAVSSRCFGENNSFYGKHHTESVKQKLSKLHTKYDKTFVENLRQLHMQGIIIADIAKMFNMNVSVVGRLIKYGTTSKKVIKILRDSINECND